MSKTNEEIMKIRNVKIRQNIDYQDDKYYTELHTKESKNIQKETISTNLTEYQLLLMKRLINEALEKLQSA